MRIEFSNTELEPLIETVVQQVLRQLDEVRSQHGDRLAYTEPEAAAALSVQPHVLRDARLRGEIAAVRMGKRWLYSREELMRFLGSGRREQR